MNKVYTRKKVMLEKKEGGKNIYGLMLKALVKGIILTFAVFAIVAYLLTYTEFKESFVSPIVIGVSVMSCFIIGYDFSKQNKENGLIYGCLGGLIYFLLYVAIGLSIVSNPIIGSQLMLIGTLSIFCGCLGGILGVNGNHR